MDLIDSHCHLTFSPLVEDIEQVIRRSRAAGVTAWVTVGTDLAHCMRAIELAEQTPNLYAAVGIHPHEAVGATEETFERLAHLVGASRKVLAIGETGLDFHYRHSRADDQVRTFTRHLDLAARLGLPLIVHSREAFDRTVEIIEPYRRDVHPIVFHCFTGTADQARLAIDRGFFLSFSGVVTFKSATDVQEAARAVPLDRVLIETDCPYLSPEPMRKQKVNEPALLVYTARFIARLQGMEVDPFAKAVADNASRFYRLPPGSLSQQ